MIPSKETLEKYIEILQCIMRIQDWDIELFIVNNNEMRGLYGDEAYGLNMTNRTVKASRIYLNSEKVNDTDTSEGWYYTLIHELFHLVHDDLDDWVHEHLENEKLCDNYNSEMERNINRLTRIFVSIYPASSLEEVTEESEGETNA